MTLYQQIEEFFNDHCDQWNYYRRPMTNPLGEVLISDFIQEFFDFGGKGMVIAGLFNEMEPMRHSHTMSAYFIGLLLKQQICPNLELLSDIEYNNYKFSYIWFIVCLFHDMGYAQENDWKYKFKYRHDSREFENYLKESKNLNSDLNKEVNYIFKRRPFGQYPVENSDLGVIFDAPHKYVYNSPFKHANDGIRFSNGTYIRNPRYSKDTILNYLEYCKMFEEINHYDHGIVGGVWLYDSLVKNHYKQYIVETKRHKSYININCFINSDNLLFSKEQWKIFSYLADCIISHNIWPANNERNDLYRECELDELLLGEFKTISFRENPVLYLLAIADTLEPIKLFSQEKLTEKEILDGISVEISSQNITMQITDLRLPFERLSNKVRDIELWLDTRVDVDYNDCKLTVYFSSKY